jgi:translation initiation factor 5B
LAGTIKSGYKLKKNDREIGKIEAIQSEGSAVDKAVTGDKVAISIDEPTVGRQIEEGDELTTVINEQTLKILQELNMKEEFDLAREII